MIAGRITDRTTTYGFPNGYTRDGSEFEVTNFSYASRGFLNDFETVGELLTGSFAEGYEQRVMSIRGTSRWAPPSIFMKRMVACRYGVDFEIPTVV